MIVTLIGYRRGGKSTVAPLLARSLDCPWVDSDDVIEREAGCSIREIFEREGEAGFRSREANVLARLLKIDPLVLSAGGGAILAEENRRQMKSAGAVVWLQADVATLAERLQRDTASGTRRPSLTGLAIDQEISDVLAVRTPLYEDAATFVVPTDGKSPEEIVNLIRDHLPVLREGTDA